MALKRLNFTKNWTNPADFPTVETDETRVRADQQLLFDEIRTFLNTQLISGLEAAGAEHIIQFTDGDGAVKYLRVNADRALETSADGMTWQAAGGAAGKSAYQSAVEAGFHGTEEEFSTALAALPAHTASTGNPHQVTAAQAGAAPARHSAQHKAGGSDPVTPAAIGALSLSGGAMNGDVSFSERGTLYELFDKVNEEMPRIAGGTYKGTGKQTTATAPMSLALTFQPRLLLIQPTGSAADSEGRRVGGLAITGTGKAYVWYSDSTLVSECVYKAIFVPNFGTTVKWYAVSDDSAGLFAQNENGNTYRYVYIG